MAGSGSPLRRRLSPKRVIRSVEKLCSMFFFKLPDHDPSESESRQRMAFDLRRRESNDFDLLFRTAGAFNRSVSGKAWAGDSQGRKRNAQSQITIDFIFVYWPIHSRAAILLCSLETHFFHLPCPINLNCRGWTSSPAKNQTLSFDGSGGISRPTGED